jgi:hypothetical protein
MPRSTTSGATDHRRWAAALALVLIAELLTATVLLIRSTAPAPVTHTMRLVDRGGPSGLPSRLTAEFGGAVDAVSTFWGDDWPAEVVVVTTGTDEDFAAQTGEPDRDWHGVAAVAVADRVDLDSHEAVGQRIVFAPGANWMTDTALRIVLRHELFHYATRTRTAFDAPRWLAEGVADYVARPAVPRPVSVQAQLPSDAELNAENGSAAYDRAWWFARFVADEYGPPALRRFYVDACGPGHPSADAAARTVFGIGLAELRLRWERWLVGGP